MRKGRELLSLPVISLDTGTRVGQIRDLLIDTSTRRVFGVVLEHEGWLREAQVIPFELLVSVGQDAVTVRDREAIVTLDAASHLHEHAKDSLLKTRGKKVFTADGTELGTVEDMVVGIPEGRVAGLELSGGIINDVMKGRAILPESDIIIFGEDAMVVSKSGAGFWQQAQM
ncbi:hypothetical protein SY88_19660 [Clostridiales bacterium PH28_bin88]|nr:hypothetical protein SY88_19660 [Clostridiales bacterium PH28_bin88]